jgi:exopolyphosphatase/guanosine-5'-triphosphate,3'-diphosphate pyrophosphatase
MVAVAASKKKVSGRRSRLPIKGGPILAYIDMGTNSFHMIVCQAVPERDHFEIISRMREAVPFFRRSLVAHNIDEHAQVSALRILREMKAKAKEKGAGTILALATSAVRESDNGKQVLDRIRRELGIEAKMISGREEARLIYLGVLWSMPSLKERFAIVDIGGGSTEIIVGDRKHIAFAESYKLGAARLSQVYFPKGQYSKAAIARLRDEVSGVLKPASSHIAACGGFSKLIGTSGTVQALARLECERTGKTVVDEHEMRLSLSRIENHVRDIEEACLSGQKIKGISSDRRQTILAGAIVLVGIMRALKSDHIFVSSAALREGAVVDRFLQTGWLDSGLERHSDPRGDSVHDLLEKYAASVEHAECVAKMASSIFHQTQGILHDYPEQAEHLLWSAAMLHDVGTFIGRKGHHKHSYYLIKNAGLWGHSEEEVELIALIARYHRGSRPKDSHPEFVGLPNDSRRLIYDLAAMLRLAEALDRSHKQIVKGVKLHFANFAKGKDSTKEIKLELECKGNANVEAEQWALQEKKSLFEEQFQVKLSVIS